MTELVTSDKEAMSALKQHGSKIVWAIILVLAGYFGWQYYQKNYAKVDTVAADIYTQITEQNDTLSLGLENPDLDDETKKQLAKERSELFAQIDKLVAAHGKTAYAWQALMIKARHQSDDEQYKEAITTLKQAQAIPLDDLGLLAMTDLRLGQVLLANQEIDAALQVANKAQPKAFEASRQELLRDIYVAKSDVEAAKKAYLAAWELLKERQESRSLLSVKIQALGLTPEPILPKSPVVAQPSVTDALAKTSGVQADNPDSTAQSK